MRRDRMTLGMILGVPLMQLLLFGFAININPQASADGGHRSPIRAPLPARSSRRCAIPAISTSSQATNSPARSAQAAGRKARCSFVVEIPANFSRDLVRGANPDLLIEADATDPAAGVAMRIGAFDATRAQRRLRDDLTGPLASRARKAAAVQDRASIGSTIRRSITQYNIVPGLLGHHPHHDHGADDLPGADARARARHLRKPAGHAGDAAGDHDRQDRAQCAWSALVQSDASCCWWRNLSSTCRCWARCCCWSRALAVFIAANLAVGYTFSTIAQNQLQAMQMTVFFLLPAILLSGFAFPFAGMPAWAQWIGEVLPATHFLRIVRGILLKGNGMAEIWPRSVAAAAFHLRGGQHRAAAVPPDTGLTDGDAGCCHPAPRDRSVCLEPDADAQHPSQRVAYRTQRLIGRTTRGQWRHQQWRRAQDIVDRAIDLEVFGHLVRAAQVEIGVPWHAVVVHMGTDQPEIVQPESAGKPRLDGGGDRPFRVARRQGTAEFGIEAVVAAATSGQADARHAGGIAGNATVHDGVLVVIVRHEMPQQIAVQERHQIVDLRIHAGSALKGGVHRQALHRAE